MSTTHILIGSLTGIHTTPIVPKGTVFMDGGRSYVYVYNFGADTFAAGDAVTISTTFVHGNVSTTDATVADVTDGTTIRPVFAGIALSPVPTTNYGWLWFAGKGTHAITTDGNVAANDLLTITNGVKIVTREVTAATAHHGIIGRAWAADSGTTLSLAEIGGQSGCYRWATSN